MIKILPEGNQGSLFVHCNAKTNTWMAMNSIPACNLTQLDYSFRLAWSPYDCNGISIVINHHHHHHVHHHHHLPQNIDCPIDHERRICRTVATTELIKIVFYLHNIRSHKSIKAHKDYHY